MSSSPSSPTPSAPRRSPSPGQGPTHPTGPNSPDPAAAAVPLTERRSTMPKALLAEFTVLPGAEARVAELVTDLAGRVREEPGNVLFEVYTKADDPRSYWIYEVYRDEGAFQEHLAAPYGAPFNAQLRDLIEEDGSVLTFLTPVV